MNTPLVTIVVVSYNHAKYIIENLDSIKAQTYTNIELIVADDASSDDSVIVFDNWLIENEYTAKKNYHTKNTGLATVLNECVEMATGKYIKLIAADDQLCFDYIERCVNKLVLDKTELVFTNAYEIDENSKIVNENYFNILYYDNIIEMENLLLKNNFISGSTLMTSLNLYQKIGKYYSKTLLEDYNLVLRAVTNNYFISSLNENLIKYRRHGDNITSTKFELLEYETIKEKIIFDKNGQYSSIIHDDIRKQKKNKNQYLSKLNKHYITYKGFNFKFWILNFIL